MVNIREGDLVEVPYKKKDEYSLNFIPQGRVKVILGNYCKVLVKLPKEKKEHLRAYKCEQLKRISGGLTEGRINDKYL